MPNGTFDAERVDEPPLSDPAAQLLATANAYPVGSTMRAFLEAMAANPGGNVMGPGRQVGPSGFGLGSGK